MAMNSSTDGWVMLHRKVAQSDIWLREPFSRGQAWLDILMHAAWKPGHVRVNGARIDYKRGQYVVSERFLAARWGWSRGKIRRFLNELKTDHRIDRLPGDVSSLITVVNYDQYQSGGPQTVQESVPPTVPKYKETKEVKNIGHFVPPSPAEVAAYCAERNNGIDAERFVDFYTANGWVQSRGKKIKCWKATVRTWEARNRDEKAKSRPPEIDLTLPPR